MITDLRHMTILPSARLTIGWNLLVYTLCSLAHWRNTTGMETGPFHLLGGASWWWLNGWHLQAVLITFGTSLVAVGAISWNDELDLWWQIGFIRVISTWQ